MEMLRSPLEPATYPAGSLTFNPFSMGPEGDICRVHRLPCKSIEGSMPPAGFRCKQCGRCCLDLCDAYQASASDEDIELWTARGREDILRWVSFIPVGKDESGKLHYVYDIWISPRTGDYVDRCPWLRKLPKKDQYVCRIHEVKPQLCRDFPISREHAEATGCRGFTDE
jgi:Fe-S-cluster containining protein